MPCRCDDYPAPPKICYCVQCKKARSHTAKAKKLQKKLKEKLLSQYLEEIEGAAAEEEAPIYKSSHKFIFLNIEKGVDEENKIEFLISSLYEKQTFRMFIKDWLNKCDYFPEKFKFQFKFFHGQWIFISTHQHSAINLPMREPH